MKTVFRNLPRWKLLVALGVLLAPAASLAEVVATDAWSRATVPGAKAAAGYMVLTNNGTEERKLLKITSPACDMVSLHQSSVDSQGVARMWPVASLKIEAGSSVRFQPNGLHVMFTGLKAPLQAGEKVPLHLRFEGDEQDMTVLLEVRPLVPAESAPARPH